MWEPYELLRSAAARYGIHLSDKVFLLTEKLRKKDYQGVSPDWKIGVISQLDIEKARERAGILENLIGYDKSKKILEIGSGSGLLVAYLYKQGYRVTGIEPDTESFNASVSLLEDNAIPKNIIRNCSAEEFESGERFDLIYSFQVLEHCERPDAVLTACSTLLDSGGHLYFVVPNYNSFWEGHYALPWFPFLGKTGGKVYVSLFGRNPNYINTLSFITPKKVRSILSATNLCTISLGEHVFYDRLLGNFETFHGDTARLLPFINMIRRIGAACFLAKIMVYFEWYYPIIIQAKK